MMEDRRMVKNLSTVELNKFLPVRVPESGPDCMEVSPKDSRFLEAQKLAHEKYAEAFRKLAE